MNILIIVNDYPYKTSNRYIFVKQLVDEWTLSGHKCSVIAPQSITNKLQKKAAKRPSCFNGYKYKLYSPKFITFGKIPLLGKMGRKLFNKVILKTIRKSKLKFDFIYAHFMISSGVAAYHVYKHYQKPFFIAFGESSFNFESFYSPRLITDVFNACSGLIAVSSEMKERLLNLPYQIPETKIFTAPNGFNRDKFYPLNKLKLRQAFNYQDNDFIIAFVGAFIERKGLNRLNQALTKINNPQIKAIFIGSGPITPTYPYTLFSGPVKHENIVKYLNACDIFVLPTLHEGSCNAIIEAIACGLPIVSSKDSFNDDLLDNSYALRIDSKQVGDIKAAILELYHNPKKTKIMAENALKAANKFDLTKRANNIINFIKTIIE